MVVIVTGAEGFVAKHLVRALRSDPGVTVIGADIRTIVDPIFDASFELDLSNISETRNLLRRTSPDVIFHLAGATQGTDDEIRSSNVDTTESLVSCAREMSRPPGLVLVGSAAEYGKVPLTQQPVRESHRGTPISAYGRAKAQVARIAAQETAKDRLRVVVARPFNIIGPGVSASLVVGAIVNRLRKAITHNEKPAIHIGATSSVRDFVAVEDVAQGLILANKYGRPGEAYNLCSGVGRSVAEALESLIKLAGGNIRVVTDPALVRSSDVDVLVGNRQKAEEELGWYPRIPFDFSLRATWDATATDFVTPSI